MIFKKRNQNKFTAISNDICTNKALSTDARWCLWYLLTKQTDWLVRIKNIQDIAGWGRDKTKNAIAELIAANYIVKRQTRAEDGQFDENWYDVYEEPFTCHPLTENPSTDGPIAENKLLNKDLEVPKTDKVENTEKNILSDAEFEEFWSAYPKRPNNPRKQAMVAYCKARKNVSQKQLLEAVGKYAAYMAGENPKFIAMASTWLNQERWNCDFSKTSEVVKSYNQVKYSAPPVSEDQFRKLVDAFPGHVGDFETAQKQMAVEMSKGATLDALCEAAAKYKLFCKGNPYEDRRIVPAMLETWLKFKWREMDAYEFCHVGPDRKKTVRPIKRKP